MKELSTKEKVLEFLEQNPDRYYSGQEMADYLFLSRTAVWKAIQSLEKDGYTIEAVTNRGYRLSNPRDTIHSEQVEHFLSEQRIPLTVTYYDTIDSTNEEAKRLAAKSLEDRILIANHQTAGKGRKGRSFHSPSGTGLYITLLLHPNMALSKLTGVTAITAVAAAKAVDKVVFDGVDTCKIKWVNDLFLNERKVSGILTEVYSSMEDESESYLIIGIGFNVYEPKAGFPKEIKKIAGALCDSEYQKHHRLTDINGIGIRTALTCELVRNFYYYFKNHAEALELYRSKSTLIGAYVKINAFSELPKSRRYAKVLGISDRYRLEVEYDDGVKDELQSGEVSVVKY